MVKILLSNEQIHTEIPTVKFWQNQIKKIDKLFIRLNYRFSPWDSNRDKKIENKTNRNTYPWFLQVTIRQATNIGCTKPMVVVQQTRKLPTPLSLSELQTRLVHTAVSYARHLYQASAWTNLHGTHRNREKGNEEKREEPRSDSGRMNKREGEDLATDHT